VRDVETLKRPFWIPETAEELRIIEILLRRRFPETYELLETSLDAMDPMDIGLPVQEGEYTDVIRELLVLLAPQEGNIGKLSVEEITDLLIEGLNRCFSEQPKLRQVRNTAELIVDR
jgi:hypothetical protein